MRATASSKVSGKEAGTNLFTLFTFHWSLFLITARTQGNSMKLQSNNSGFDPCSEKLFTPVFIYFSPGFMTHLIAFITHLINCPCFFFVHQMFWFRAISQESSFLAIFCADSRQSLDC